ncbi:MAG: helix-turn-helix transcriptional regulator [Anaerolineae bacterium]
MDFKDASARFKSKQNANQAGEAKEPKPHDFAESYRIRAKMVGVLLRDARLNAERTIEDCAQLLLVTPDEMQAWEMGDSVPSLPQIELLAYYLGVSVSHFWGTDTLESKYGRHVDIQSEYVALRNRMIGALVRQAREENNLSLEEISQSSAISHENLELYEVGELPIPMHELSVLSSILKRNTSYFLETSGYIGEWLAMREQWKHFSALPTEQREFAANPRNIGFIEIAIMLSKMPVENLRQVGASILDITR